jgi:hypothetical protein
MGPWSFNVKIYMFYPLWIAFKVNKQIFDIYEVKLTRPYLIPSLRFFVYLCKIFRAPWRGCSYSKSWVQHFCYVRGWQFKCYVPLSFSYTKCVLHACILISLYYPDDLIMKKCSDKKSVSNFHKITLWRFALSCVEMKSFIP